jgi:hypothetical protein
MEFDRDLIQRGKALTAPLPDYAANAFERLVDSVDATAGRELTEREERQLRDDAAEAMAGLVAAESEAGNDSSRLVSIGEVVAWVREIQEMLEADAN